MKILYIITQADGGGAQRYVLAMAKHFGGSIAAGVESTQLFDEAKKIGVPTYALKHLKRAVRPFHDIAVLFEIMSLIKKDTPDIIHLNSSKAGALGSLVGKLSGVKVIYTAHGFVFNESLSPIRKQLYTDGERLASLFRDHIIAVSDVDRMSALTGSVTSAEKITTVHNGISPQNFLSMPEARQKLGLPENKFIFGTVANFYRTKGLDVLIEAIALLPPHYLENTLWVIIGYGDEGIKKQLESAIKNKNLTANILLLGKVIEASQYMKAFDSYILASRKEGLPYAILDALQAGLPIIATGVGGIPEALGNGGMVIDLENPKMLSEAITTLRDNQKKREDLSQKALARSTLFTETKMFAETEEIYRRVLENT